MSDGAFRTGHAAQFFGLKDLLVEINRACGILAHDGRRDGMVPVWDCLDCTHGSSFENVKWTRRRQKQRVGKRQGALRVETLNTPVRRASQARSAAKRGTLQSIRDNG